MKNLVILLGFLLFPVTAHCGWWNDSWDYCLTVELKDPGLKEFQKTAELVFPVRGEIGPKGEDVRVVNEKGKTVLCRVKKAVSGGECRLFFQVDSSNRYQVYYGNRNAKPEFQDTLLPDTTEYRLFLDDYLYPDARTSGFWLWKSYPKISGLFAHGDPSGETTFHSVFLTPPVPFKENQQLVQYVFLDGRDTPGEIMVELYMGGNRYQFSWGADLIKWRDSRKKTMGPLPATGRWQKLEIPLAELKERREISGIGFYHAGGQVFWDRSSINEVPLTAAVTGWQKKKTNLNAYFTWEGRGPYRTKENNFYYLKLDAAPSESAASYQWEVNGKTFMGRTVDLALPINEKTAVTLTTRDKKGQKDSWTTDVVSPKNSTARDLKIVLKPVLRSSFAYPGESIAPAFLITSLTPEVLELTAGFRSEKRGFSLLPGRGNSQVIAFPYVLGNGKAEEVFDLAMGDTIIMESKLLFRPLDQLEQPSLAGPSLADSAGDVLTVIIPDYRFEEKILPVEREIRIKLIGDYPPELPAKITELFAQKNIRAVLDAVPYPDENSYHILADFLFLREKLSGQDYDLAVLFPSLDSLRHKTSAAEWKKALDASTWFLCQSAGKVILVSPFPSAPIPETFLPYSRAAQQIAQTRNVSFLDLYALYTNAPGWERYFTRSEGVYQDLPIPEGLELLTRELFSLMTEQKLSPLKPAVTRPAEMSNKKKNGGKTAAIP